MHQTVERGQTVGLIEDFGRQALPVDGAVRVQNASPELPDHIRIGLAAGKKHFVAELIGLDQVTPQCRQSLADKSLAAGQTSGQTNFQHTAASRTPMRRSADPMVLTMSIAMVSGPTPPGTGVYAPARPATSSGCTSPTSSVPFLSKEASFSAAPGRPAGNRRSISGRVLRRFMPTSITVAPRRM